MANVDISKNIWRGGSPSVKDRERQDIRLGCKNCIYIYLYRTKSSLPNPPASGEVGSYENLPEQVFFVYAHGGNEKEVGGDDVN
jgi:hypothetical protein